MCGRYTLTKPIKAVANYFSCLKIDLQFAPRYNIAPGQVLPVVLSIQGKPELKGFRWGLVPRWAAGKKAFKPLINARAETIHEKPSFKDSFRTQRCLIPADGFIEWKKQGNGKTPHYISMKNQALFAFAGLWSETPTEGEPLRSYAVVTTEANSILQSIHHRMPVILSQNTCEDWLSPSNTPEELQKLLVPLHSDKMEVRPLSSMINSAKNDVPECLSLPPESTLF